MPVDTNVVIEKDDQPLSNLTECPLQRTALAGL
jgi:hypothetical protein